jgi:hypothetical protein
VDERERSGGIVFLYTYLLEGVLCSHVTDCCTLRHSLPAERDGSEKRRVYCSLLIVANECLYADGPTGCG